MLLWLADRCEEFELTVETPESTLHRLAERSQQIPGMSLQVLNKAHKRRSKMLMRQLVEKHVFGFNE